MSYSRWSNSVWYTYADTRGGFTVAGEKTFSDEELKDIPACRKLLKARGYSEAELNELEGYIREYLAEDWTAKLQMQFHSFD